jgi:hypothetical protein
MNHQPTQHTSTIQWSAIPGNQLQQTSEQHPPSQHQLAPHRPSCPATSLSLPQVGCSVMHLQSETPTNHPWQTVKGKRTHLPMETATRGHLSPCNCPNQFEELSHLPDDNIQIPASDPHTPISSEQVTQLSIHKPPPIYVYGVTNYRDMVQYLTETLEKEQY